MADELNMFFPRMHSNKPEHVVMYKDWVNFKGTPVKYNKCGQIETVYKPTMAENLRFFFSYQINFMYWRYFMWNFSGRQNDIQNLGARPTTGTGLPVLISSINTWWAIRAIFRRNWPITKVATGIICYPCF